MALLLGGALQQQGGAVTVAWVSLGGAERGPALGRGHRGEALKQEQHCLQRAGSLVPPGVGGEQTAR